MFRNKIIQEDLQKIINNDLDWSRFNNSTFLITGACGMLASYIVFTLMYLNKENVDANIKVIGICRNKDKAKKKFISIMDHPMFSIVYQDIESKIDIDQKIDYIVHAASLTNAQHYAINPVGVISLNVFGTKNLLEFARKKNVRGFLYFSSGDVSGVVDKELIDEGDYGYLDPTDIKNCYSESKRISENMCQCWNYQYDVPTYIVRPDHTYGPTMDLENDDRVFAQFVSDVINNRDIVVRSDGSAERTFCYIADATEGFFRVLINGSAGGVYNISNNNAHISIRGLAEILVSLFPERCLSVVYKDRKRVEYKDKIRPILSTEKIKQLGYSPFFSIKEGFRRTINSLELR
jgi:nucleoside-diphosphate-sugar epimerase